MQREIEEAEQAEENDFVRQAGYPDLAGEFENTYGARTEPAIWGPGVSKIADYTFQNDNPYLAQPAEPSSSSSSTQAVVINRPMPIDTDGALALAKRLIDEGKDLEAIQVLEVEVQRQPDSAEAWCLMGQTWAYQDQDERAIQCLVKGHDADPYNLDSLSSLAVCCTNDGLHLEALRYLHKWIESHEEFGVLLRTRADSGASVLDQNDFSDYEKLRDEVTSLLQTAADEVLARGPTDPVTQAAQAKEEASLFVVLGVVLNVNRAFGAAVKALRAGVERSPMDASLWNKLGATLANSGNPEAALTCYYQALALKPNCARSWSNLAVAHANLGNHEDAARFYLSSLVLNPKADHLWSFVHTTMINLASDIGDPTNQSLTDVFNDPTGRAGLFGPNAGSDDLLSQETLATRYLKAAYMRDMDECRKLIPDILESADALPPRSTELDRPLGEILAELPTGDGIAKA
ncbi:unnamed protein product [Amoebophrya sp. A25]|nr:unnamed protein product [Amoebophrya sp. A25]|eukprot:GSA25T00020529001.1